MKKMINTKNLPVISISGRKGYGKDFWANYLVKRYKNVEKVAFADKLREEVDSILKYISENKSIDYISNQIKATEEEIKGFIEIYDKSPIKWPELNSWSRTNIMLKLLQYWGTSVRRVNYNKNYWVDKLYNEVIRPGNKKGITYVISDARFPNEVDSVHDEKGLTVTIIISDEEQIRRLQARDGFVPDLTQLSHISETGLDGYSNFDLTLLTEFNSDELTQELLEEKIDNWSNEE